MGLIATIHTTDIELMAELVDAAKHHGPVEIRYVDGGLELHRADTGPDAVVFPLNTTAAPAAPRPASKPKTAPKTTATKAGDATTCPDCGHVAATANGLGVHRARKHGVAGAHANGAKRPRRSATATPSVVDHDAIRARAAEGI